MNWNWGIWFSCWGFLLVLAFLAQRGWLLFIWRWLKGSRKIYFWIDNKEIGSCRNRPTESCQRNFVEINRGPLRRRSGIYGPAAENWEVEPLGTGDLICLSSKEVNHPIDALRLINTYPSFQAMLNRIAELEGKLETANSRRQDMLAAFYTLRQIMVADKQRFRSPAAQNIAKSVSRVISLARQTQEPEPSEIQIVYWKRIMLEDKVS